MEHHAPSFSLSPQSWGRVLCRREGEGEQSPNSTWQPLSPQGSLCHVCCSNLFRGCKEASLEPELTGSPGRWCQPLALPHPWGHSHTDITHVSMALSKELRTCPQASAWGNFCDHDFGGPLLCLESYLNFMCEQLFLPSLILNLPVSENGKLHSFLHSTHNTVWNPW